MTPRTICMTAIFSLGLLANAAFALWLPAEIRFWRTPLTFESVSSNETHVYALKFEYGRVDLDFASFGAGGEMHSFHLHY